MIIKEFPITIKELFKGYKDNSFDNDTEDDSVVAFGGKLNIRPAYQREFIYNEKQQQSVIESILKDRPLNIMYWAVGDNNTYELLDGQQRTLSICRFLDHKFSIKYKNLTIFEDTDNFTEFREKILNYKLLIYICEGTNEEKLEWFKTINMVGEKLKEQEMLNAVYTGSWLSDAKYHFSRKKSKEAMISKKYIDGNADRQDYLSEVLHWICDKNNLKSNDQYMAIHQKDENANELIFYFNNVISWIKKYFIEYNDVMKKVKWGLLYNKYKDYEYDPEEIQNKIKKCLKDRDVTNKKGIYDYVLSGNESSLQIRKFDEEDKLEKYKLQEGKCNCCKKYIDIEDAVCDHIQPWSKGGKTIKENLQILCIDCNLKKSNKSPPK